MKRFLWVVLLLVAVVLLVGCNQAKTATTSEGAAAPQAQECPTCAACSEAATCPEPVACPEASACPEPIVANVPFAEAWANSPHNDKTSEAFIHWDGEDPAVVPGNCAKCHSETGYLDFLGADGSEPGVVNAENVPIGTTVTCVACHNEVTVHKTSVIFPSGQEITGLGDESRCMECHQGRESKVSVDKSIADLNLTDKVDEVSADLGFRNIHYFAAAATMYGAEALGGYQYEGKAYDVKFEHVEGFDSCTSCHNSHTLELKLDLCQSCHADTKSAEDLAAIRMAGSEADYDGDGDVKEGIMEELTGVQETLLTAIQSYATEVAGAPIAYSSAAYPYFFADANANGAGDEGETKYVNWTPRLLKAGYNYQVASKDPGTFAHNGKYIIQLMYDSIEDLNQALKEPVDMAAMHRNDPGHFAGSTEPFRHWDEEGKVPGGCVKCHQAEGLPEFVAEGANVSKAPSNGFMCTTCHTDFKDFARMEISEVKFPSGASVTMDDADSNLCISCHQGRASSNTIDSAVKGVDEDAVPEKALRFTNIHYFAAAATLFGNDVKGAYQYPDLTYLGKYNHVPKFKNCTDCHDAHELEVKTDSCFTCHDEVADLREIRDEENTNDFDGDGDVTEGLGSEIQAYSDKLYAAMQDYAANVAGKPIIYSPAAYPYFFEDTDGNGEIGEGEEGYTAWTPRLLKAAYNYQYVQKDPGAFAHNGKYVIQFLYDSLSSLGQKVTVDMTGMVRPETPAPQ
ncbi:MAG: hypothetical protein ABTQ73_02150 [Caldilineales bacterium]